MKKAGKSAKIFTMFLIIFAITLSLPLMASAHCDTMDGPTVADAKKAIETNNVNFVLKWVTTENEKEISQIFELAMKVRKLGPEAKELADRYFFENLVRIHRAGEGASYTGLKPSGTPVEEKVLAADKSIEIGNLSPLEEIVPQDKMSELKERFEKVMSLRNFDVNNVEAGREYIEAYVAFFHFAEGEEEGNFNHTAEAGHDKAAEDAHAAEVKADYGKEIGNTHAAESTKGIDTLLLAPWGLAIIFFITTIIFGTAYIRKTSKLSSPKSK